MAQKDSKAELSRFLNALREDLGWEFEREEFDDRFRLQKYVILAEEFGFDHNYNYGIHLRGPYSPALAEDYYEELPELSDEHPEGFDSEGFAGFVDNRDKEWLEIAGTLRAYFLRCPSFQDDALEWAIDQTVQEKGNEEAFVESVAQDLLDAGVIERN